MCTGEGKLTTETHQSIAQHHLYLRASKELTELGQAQYLKILLPKNKC